LLSYSRGNNISGNDASNSKRGIHLNTCDGNTISRNNIVSNSVSGLFMTSTSNNNIVFDNYFNNYFNIDVKDGSFGNALNTTKTQGTNIVGGPYIGGNFWAKPDGTGFSQTATDGNGDGIADTVFVLLSNNYADFLSLVGGSAPEVNGPAPEQPAPPVADLNAIETGENETEAGEMEIDETETDTIGKEMNETETGTGKTETGETGLDETGTGAREIEENEPKMDTDETNKGEIGTEEV
jgi:parallel beta-helix repeat protein